MNSSTKIFRLALSFALLVNAGVADTNEQVFFLNESENQTLTTADTESAVSIPDLPSEVELSDEWKVRIPMAAEWYITSDYGMRCGVPGVYSGCAQHTGLDFGNGPTYNQPVYSTTYGVVSFTSSFGGVYIS